VGIPDELVAEPYVVVVVLNWNGAQDTLRCLESLQKVAYRRCDVLVVDNGSSDDSVGLLRRAFPDVELIETGDNLGYAGGNNVGIERALARGADYIVLLNNDTVVDPGFLDTLVEVAGRYPKAAFLGPKILYLDRPDILWFGGGRIDWSNGPSHIDHDTKDVLADTTAREVDYITGCCLMVRASAITAIGVMDPRFFLLFEESDWCVRARERGWQSVYVPHARILHAVSQSFGGPGSPTYRYYFARNELLFYSKHLRGFPLVRALRNAHRRDLHLYRYLRSRGCLREARHIVLGIGHFWRRRFGRL
jgi:GT2 family glycosyltransferase